MALAILVQPTITNNNKDNKSCMDSHKEGASNKNVAIAPRSEMGISLL